MLVDYIRQIYSSQRFRFKDNFRFNEFDDSTGEIVPEGEVPDTIEIWAAVEVPYEGEVPESYKVLNLMIGDWVIQHERELTKVIHEKLTEHFKANYPESDPSELSDTEESAIWLDQLDYMPRLDEDKKTITIEIETVIDAEPLEKE